MMIDNLGRFLLLMSIVAYQHSFYIAEKYRVYTEPSWVNVGVRLSEYGCEFG